MAARLLLLLALCAAAALPSVVLASRSLSSRRGFVVRGRVFCDTCQAGFETPLTTYIAGAQVKVICKDRHSGQLTRSVEGTTDETGTYNIYIADEHEDEVCESVLVSSPIPSCSKILPGRDCSSVVLTHNNGIPADVRFANNMGFIQNSVLEGCAKVMAVYQQYEEDE